MSDLLADIPGALMLRKKHSGVPLIIVFSSVNSNGFSFFKTLKALPYAKLFIRDPEDCWFQRGITPEVNSPDRLAGHLRAMIAKLRPGRIITTGASMGGYAALLFGHLLRAQAVFAMSPQTIIDRGLPHTPAEDFTGAPYFDLAPLVRIQNRHRPATHVLFGADDLADVWNAGRLTRRAGDARYAIAGRDHLASNFVATNGDLVRALTALAEGQPVELAAPLDDRCETPRTQAILDRLVRSLFLEAPDLEPELWVERLKRLHPNWSVPFEASTSLARRLGDLSAASQAAGRAAALSPLSITLHTNHAELLTLLAREADAMRAFEACLEIRPGHYAALCGLAILRARANDQGGALALLDQAIERRPRVARAVRLRELIATGEIPPLSPRAVPGEVAYPV